MNGNLGNDLEGMVIVYLMILPLHSPTETGEYQKEILVWCTPWLVI